MDFNEVVSGRHAVNLLPQVRLYLIPRRGPPVRFSEALETAEPEIPYHCWLRPEGKESRAALEHDGFKFIGFADQGLCPLLPSLGPMALRSQAHAGVPPLSVALRGGESPVLSSQNRGLGRLLQRRCQSRNR
jgi:hypothetical protein